MDRKLLGVAWILLGLFLLGAIIGFAYYMESLPTYIKSVDCYDRNYNVIQGVSCDEKVFEEEWINQAFDPYLVMALFMCIILLGFILVLYGVLLLTWRES